MTHATTNPILANKRPSILSRIWAFFVAHAAKQDRADRIAQLQALSDEQLAERGITRDGIARHVFSDKLHL